MALPDKDIVTVHRSDGSGTTYIFTDYLSTVSPKWKEQVGTSTTVNWPGGLGGRGNEGVAGEVKQNPYSLGYVEYIYAKQNKLGYAEMKNKAGAVDLPGRGRGERRRGGVGREHPARPAGLHRQRRRATRATPSPASPGCWPTRT